MPRVFRYLTDEQMRAVVDLADAGASAARVARAIGAPYFTVHKAVARVKARGWSIPLLWSRCAVCGRPVAGPPPNARLLGRDDACRRARVADRARAQPGQGPGRAHPRDRPLARQAEARYRRAEGPPQHRRAQRPEAPQRPDAGAGREP